MTEPDDPQAKAQEDPRAQPPPPADGLPPNPIPPSCLLVGLGASAGGVQALRKFFANVRADSDMAYIVVLHLSREHESNLVGVLQAVAEIPVVLVTEPTAIQPNHVYVVPPNHRLFARQGWLQLADMDEPRSRMIPIDLFFRSL